MQRKHKLLILLSTCLIITLTACQIDNQPQKIGDLDTSSQLPSEETNLIPEETVYEVGDIISIDDTILVVLGWDQPPGGDLNPPDEGKKYLVVDLILANQGKRSFNSSPVFQMSLKAPSGQKFNLNGKANLASGSNQPNGEINPGEIIRGKVGFHVPEDLTDFTFVYEANLLGHGEVSVNLGPVPIVMDPPEDLALIPSLDVYQIGDPIEFSDLLIQIMEVSYPLGTEIVKPKEGFKFVAVDIQIENQGSSVQEITSVVQMYLKDETGQKYTFHLGAQSLLDTGLPDDELQPGERVRGQIGFQAPESAQELVFVFDAEIFGFGKVFIALH
jgi:signal peptidase I